MVQQSETTIRSCRKLVPWQLLNAKNFPAEHVSNLRRGAAIFDKNYDLLNSKGLDIRDHLFRFSQRVVSQAYSDTYLQNYLRWISSQSPRIENPHLELFTPPDSYPFEAIASVRRDPIISFEIMSGCQNQCTCCLAGTPSKTESTEYIKILLIFEMAKRYNIKIRFNTVRIEILHYGDPFWKADFGDVYKASHDVLSAYTFGAAALQTHGSPHTLKNALATYKKLSSMGIEIRRLSVHLFHKEFNGPDRPSEEILNEYAARFIEAIEYLKPAKIALRGLGLRHGFFSENDCAWINKNPEWLHFKFIESFFWNRVFPFLSHDLQKKYTEKIPDVSGERFKHIGLEDWINIVRASSPLVAPNKVKDATTIDFLGYENLEILPDGRWRINPQVHQVLDNDELRSCSDPIPEMESGIFW